MGYGTWGRVPSLLGSTEGVGLKTREVRGALYLILKRRPFFKSARPAYLPPHFTHPVRNVIDMTATAVETTPP